MQKSFYWEKIYLISSNWDQKNNPLFPRDDDEEGRGRLCNQRNLSNEDA